MVKPFLSKNASFSTSFNYKSKAFRWNDAKCLFMCYFTCQAHIAVLTWFLILGKIQDGDHFWWRHRPSAAPPIKFTSSFWKDPRLSTEGKIVSKYCNISKTRGRGSNILPPCITVGVWICGYVRGLRSLDIGQVRFFRSYQPRRRKGVNKKAKNKRKYIQVSDWKSFTGQ